MTKAFACTLAAAVMITVSPRRRPRADAAAARAGAPGSRERRRDVGRRGRNDGSRREHDALDWRAGRHTRVRRPLPRHRLHSRR